MSDPIHIISLGAGVQSSCMSLMAAAGEITPMPTCAIFADTQAEPKSVYTWLDWLEKQLPFPVMRISKGSLADVMLTPYVSRKNKKITVSGIPAYVENRTNRFICDGCATPLLEDETPCPECGCTEKPKLLQIVSAAMMPRQCTKDFKIDPITKTVNRLRRENGNVAAILWIGISTDEIYRAKENRHQPRIINRWPLLERRISRSSCIKWMVENKFPKPPRSACVFCPYHNDHEWRRLREQEPDAFSDAIAFELRMQSTLKDSTLKDSTLKDSTLKGTPYLHRSMKPLSEVDFSTEEERGQLNMFNNECEGMCGV